MAFQMQRTRSAHSIHRPLSRASTQSAQSPAPDLQADIKYQPNAFMQQQAQQQHQHAQRTQSMMMDISYANAQQGPHLDAFMQMQAQQLPMNMQQFPDPSQQFMPDNSYMMAGDTNYPMPHPHMSMQQFPPQLNGSEPEDKRRKGSSATATNDKELRELLVRNEGRGLPEVAQEVIAKERTPQAEKTKQLFAMLW